MATWSSSLLCPAGRSWNVGFETLGKEGLDRLSKSLSSSSDGLGSDGVDARGISEGRAEEVVVEGSVVLYSGAAEEVVVEGSVGLCSGAAEEVVVKGTEVM